jgi:hypothetical protein
MSWAFRAPRVFASSVVAKRLCICHPALFSLGRKAERLGAPCRSIMGQAYHNPGHDLG